jgi:hypothetical protein
MLVRSQSGPIKHRVQDFPFSYALIGGDPNLFGNGPLPSYAYKKHVSQ